jgi:YVTN family beta-propeller protein
VLNADGGELFVVNPESDSVSRLNVRARKLEQEILLGSGHPTLSASSDYTPVIMPRALALSPDQRTLYVTGQRSASLYAIDLATNRARGAVRVGSEPIGVVVSNDGSSVFVACSQDGTVVRIASSSLRVTAAVHVKAGPWALALSSDESRLFVSHLLDPSISVIDTQRMALKSSWPIPDVAPRSSKPKKLGKRRAAGNDPRLAHGQPRGMYDLALRPGTRELWLAHTLLGTDTAQPALDFESSAFPALGIFHTDGRYEQTLASDAPSVAGSDGAFADVVSGPHALAFTADGAYALLVDANSEDVLVVDAARRAEHALVRPLPGQMPDGIALSPDDHFAYVDERVSGDIAVLELTRNKGGLSARVAGATIARFERDPMPSQLRLGQELFNTANSGRYPITTEHWLACASCHMEGRSDAVTWRFEQGPRDTPSNAGGLLGTGFLFRTADRSQVSDYFHTINTEQGGRFDPARQKSLLDALTAYVNHALPAPVPPTTNPALAHAGERVFKDAGCARCHAGPHFTDSGSGNPSLDLQGRVVLHEVGTCVTSGSFSDVAHLAVNGDARVACAFDTPSLNGVASSPPYLHDGSAPTLLDAILRMPDAPHAEADQRALLEYVRSL